MCVCVGGGGGAYAPIAPFPVSMPLVANGKDMNTGGEGQF